MHLEGDVASYRLQSQHVGHAVLDVVSVCMGPMPEENLVVFQGSIVRQSCCIDWQPGHWVGWECLHNLTTPCTYRELLDAKRHDFFNNQQLADRISTVSKSSVLTHEIIEVDVSIIARQNYQRLVLPESICFI